MPSQNDSHGVGRDPRSGSRTASHRTPSVAANTTTTAPSSGDATRAAQARRRQRIVAPQQQSHAISSGSHSNPRSRRPTARSTAITTAPQSSSTRTPPWTATNAMTNNHREGQRSSSNNHSDGDRVSSLHHDDTKDAASSLLDRSMEAGQDAAFLLQSMRQTTSSTSTSADNATGKKDSRTPSREDHGAGRRQPRYATVETVQHHRTQAVSRQAAPTGSPDAVSTPLPTASSRETPGSTRHRTADTIEETRGKRTTAVAGTAPTDRVLRTATNTTTRLLDRTEALATRATTLSRATDAVVVGPPSLVDAATVRDQSLVLIQSNVAPLHASLIVHERDSNDDNDKNPRSSKAATATLSATGRALGRPLEVFRIARCASSSKRDDDTSLELRHGDVVTISHQPHSSENSPLLFLGVAPLSAASGSSTTNETDHNSTPRTVALYPAARLLSQSQQQWVVLHGDTTIPIRVGRAAQHDEAIQRVQQQQQQSNRRRPIQAGQCVVLRHVTTGGVLSCRRRRPTDYSSYDTSTNTAADADAVRDGGLILLTDAYLQPETAPPDPDEDICNPDAKPSSMIKLHRSAKLLPSDCELFWLQPPTCPAMAACGGGRGMVDWGNGSYLCDPKRNDPTSTALQQSDDRSKNGLIPRSAAEQEQVLLGELIGICMGLEGRYIRAVAPGVDASSSGQSLAFNLFDVEDGVAFDSILRSLVESMICLPTNVCHVQAFVGQHTPGYQYGRSMQALCERMAIKLEEHMSTVLQWHEQYESGNLTSLRLLQVQVRSSVQCFAMLDLACTATQDKKGGALVNELLKLQRNMYNGDEPVGRELDTLLEASAAPLLHGLGQWIDHGILETDPHEEFMIQEKPAASWEDKYAVAKDHVLIGVFGSEETVNRVLAAGRYWNAVRACGHQLEAHVLDGDESAQLTSVSKLQYTTNPTDVASLVLKKYNESSRTLLNLLLKDYNLICSLRVMKRFFLLEYGDFFVNFLDKAEDELHKSLISLSRNRIQHWMEGCLELLEHRGVGLFDAVENSSSLISSKHCLSGLRVCFSRDSLTDNLDKLHAATGGIDTDEPWTPMRHAYGAPAGNSSNKKTVLTGLDTIFLELTEIPFPLSLVLSPSAVDCYKLLFRHLFFAKHVERRLVSIWKDHQTMKELQVRGSMGPTFLLRQRMLHFLQNIMYYMMGEVIEPNWIRMEQKIKNEAQKEHTVDDILRIHHDFLQRTLEACLLTNRELVRALTKLMKTCLLFSEQMKRFMKATKIDEDRKNVATEMRKAVQNNLTTRGGARSSVVSSKRLKDTLKGSQADRLKRTVLRTGRAEREISADPYRRMVSRFEEVFSKNLKDFMMQLTSSDDLYHTHKVNLCIRLDYNGFVTSSLGLT